jgi:hypothetical protein
LLAKAIPGAYESGEQRLDGGYRAKNRLFEKRKMEITLNFMVPAHIGEVRLAPHFSKRPGISLSI